MQNQNYDNLVNGLYKVLLKKYGNKIIHSSELVNKFISNPYIITKKLVKEKKISYVEKKGLFGITKKAPIEEWIEVEKETKEETPYIISEKRIIEKLDKGEKIIFSIGGGIFFTTTRVIFCDFPLYKTEIKDAFGDIESLFYSDIILLQKKGKDSKIYDGLSGGRFFSGLESATTSDDHYVDYFGTDSFIGYGGLYSENTSTIYLYGWMEFNPPKEVPRHTGTFIKLPKNCIIDIGNDINEFLNKFIKSEFNLGYLPQVKQSFEVIENSKRVLDALTSNQTAFEKDELLNMIKLQSFIKGQEKSLVNTIQKINGLDDNHILDLDTSFLEYIIDQFKNLNVLTDLTLRMINLKKDGDLLNYTIIYNEFENLGVFTKEFEKQLLGSVRTVSDKIDRLDISLGNLTEVMKDISSDISMLDDTVRRGLWDIHSEIMNLK